MIACYFSKPDGACYGQDADKNRMARYVHTVFLAFLVELERSIKSWTRHDFSVILYHLEWLSESAPDPVVTNRSEMCHVSCSWWWYSN